MNIPNLFTIEISMVKQNGDVKIFVYKEIQKEDLLSCLKKSLNLHPHFKSRMQVTLSLKNNDFYRGRVTDLMEELMK